MTTIQSKPVGKPPVKSKSSSKRARYFYLGAAALLFVLMFWGFQQFYLHGKAYPGRELVPPIRTLLIMHGVAMMGWMVLILVQPLLIVSGKVRVHMMMGRLGAALAVAIVILGVLVGIRSARVNPPDLLLWGMNPRQFLAVPLISIVTFGVFVGLGIWKRRRPDAHRPLMLLATLAVMPAAMDRIDVLHNAYTGTMWGTYFGPYFSTLVVGLLFVVLHCVLTGKVNRWLAFGYVGLVVLSALTVQLGMTQAWGSFADLLLGPAQSVAA